MNPNSPALRRHKGIGAKNTVKESFLHLYRRPLFFILTLAPLLNLIIEVLSRRSLVAGIAHIFLNSPIFLYNSLIIMFTLSLSYIFRKQGFVLVLISFGWLALALTNFILLGFRTTPLAAIDFELINSVYEIIDVYLTFPQIVAICLSLVAIIGAIVALWFKMPAHKVKFLKSATRAVALGLAVVGSTLLSIKTNAISESYGNLSLAYSDYGFAYCFSRSVIDRGIDKPPSYSKETMKTLMSSIKEVGAVSGGTDVNIVMVQLESFFDVNYLKNYEFSEDPVPNFTALKQDFSSGFLTVPSIGAGTANTEFEVLSGMDLKYFGTGEYPYKTILKSSTSETIGYNLKKTGRTAHAIHNNSGTFYDRHLVYPNLGFDTFTSLEYMDGVDFSPTGWAKDMVLTENILNCLNSTEGSDFVFTVSVQPHGSYPKEVVDSNQKIQLTKGIDPIPEKKAFEYYINQLNETDAFIRNLTDSLTNFSERTVVVFYGDHLPSLNIEDGDISNGDVFQTEYLLWSNFPLEKKDIDLSAYQLSAYVLDRLDIHSGIITKLHQNYSDSMYYPEALEMLQYDMLYGEKTVYNGRSPHMPTDMTMGVTDITIGEVRQLGDTTYVFGSGFTPWTTILIDGKRCTTTYISQNALMTDNAKLDPGDTVEVAQIGNDRFILGSSNALTYTGNRLEASSTPPAQNKGHIRSNIDTAVRTTN